MPVGVCATGEKGTYFLSTLGVSHQKKEWWLVTPTVTPRFFYLSQVDWSGGHLRVHGYHRYPQCVSWGGRKRELNRFPF